MGTATVGNVVTQGNSPTRLLGPHDDPRDSASRIARNIRRFSALIIIGWVALTLLVTFGVPRLEIVGQQHSVPLAPQDAPAVQAMQRMGRDFKESDSDSFAMLVIEGQQQLGDSAHAYYDKLVRELKADTKHIEHVQDLWETALPRRAPKVPTARPSMCS